MTMRPLALLLLAGLVCCGEVVVPAGTTESLQGGFRILSQCPPADTAAVANELARVRGALAAWIGGNVRPLPSPLPVLPVLLFRDRASFTAYASTHASNVATAHAEGYYSGNGTAGGGYLALFQDGGRELATARHELLHHLLDLVLPARPGQPVWFNEGLAVVAENSWIDPGAVRPTTIPAQRSQLLTKLAAEGGGALASITALGSDGWLAAAADRDAAERQYTSSYGAVLYLLNAHPDLYWGFLRRLAKGEAHDAAYNASFAGISGGLDAAWRGWVARDAWTAARANDGSESAAAAFEHGLALLPEHGAPGDPILAARWLSAAARGFEATPGYELDAATAWLEAARALDSRDPAAAGEAAETAAKLFAGRGHRAGQAEAMIAATRAWGDDGPGGDWRRAVQAGRIAVQLAEAVGPDSIRAAAYGAYGACFIHGRIDGEQALAEGKSALKRARELHHADKDPAGEAAIVLLLAQLMTPADGARGDRAGCLALVGEAEALWKAMPDAATHGDDLARASAVRGGLLRPDRAPDGDWAAALAAYETEARLSPQAEVRLRLRNLLDRASCRLGLGDAGATALFTQAETLAESSGDASLAGYAAYQAGWSVLSRDPGAAATAFARAMTRYHAAGKTDEETMAAGQLAQALQSSKAPATTVAAAYAVAADLEIARGNAARSGHCLYQQAWFSEPSRQPGADPTVAIGLYRRSAQAWQESEPAKAAQALAQRARLSTPAAGAAAGWDDGARAWAESAAAMAALPDAEARQGARGSALHQQAWCMIHGDAKLMTAAAKRVFSEAVRLQRAGGDEAGATTSASWIRE